MFNLWAIPVYQVDLTVLLTLFISSIIGAGIGVWFSVYHNPANAQRTVEPSSPPTPNDDAAVFLFEGDTLLDASPAAMTLFHQGSAEKSGLARLCHAFDQRFPALLRECSSTQENRAITLFSETPKDPDVLEILKKNGVTRIAFKSQNDINEDPAEQALAIEADTLRSVVEHAPILTWKQDENGTLLWANKAYLNATESNSNSSGRSGWPPKPIFDADALNFDQGTQRIQSNHAAKTWFDCSNAQTPAGTLFFAKKVDDVIKAESSLRDFVQTVSKSFASLHIGIAIFDDRQKLTLFNPALASLTSLPVEFLAAKPSMRVLLDRLRNDRMIPEPKNYKYWRDQILSLGQDQVEDGYEEMWSLPSGRTYRIVIRPHSNHSIAMHIEDISTELSLTRHFRAELSLSQAIIDEIPEGIAVFSASGPLTLSNAGYADIWGIDPSTTLGEFNITEAVKMWRKACKPTDVWARLVAFSSQTGNREAWNDHIETHDGTRLLCGVSAIQGGATSVRFRRLIDIQQNAEPQLLQSNLS